MTIPPASKLKDPVLSCLRAAGGAASNTEIREAVAKALALTDEEISQKHKGDGRTELEYRLAWARTHLAKGELIRREGSGRWQLTERGRAALDNL